MKKFIIFLKLQLMFMTFVNISYSANEPFRSNGSGNWNDISIWQYSTNGGSTFVNAPTSPNNTSGEITIRNSHTIAVNVNVTADQLVINTGGQISINSGITLTVVNSTSQDLKLDNGAFINGPGTLSAKGNTVDIIITSGANFNSPLSVDSGTVVAGDAGSPLVGKINGAVTISSGATLIPNSGHTLQVNGNLTNNGTIGTSTNPVFSMRGASMINNGIVNVQTFRFDSTTALSGSGSYSGLIMIIGSSANISLSSDVTFSPLSTLTANSGAVINPNGNTLTINTSASYTFNSGVTVTNSGTLRTQGTPTIVIKQGANFLVPLKINTGTATITEGSSPFAPVVDGAITVDAGASLIPGGGHTLVAKKNVTNNGTLAPNTNAKFSMNGTSLINNGAVTINEFRFDSVTTVSGSGSYSSPIMSIGSGDNVTLANDVTFSASSGFTINQGGTLNPNGNVVTFNTGIFNLKPFSTVSNPGTLRTQNSVRLTIDTASAFNAALKVNSGTATASQSTVPFIPKFNGAIIIDNGAELTNTGGSSPQANGNVTNNGIMNQFNSNFKFNGPSFVNNGTVNYNMEMLSGNHSISGTGVINSIVTFLNGSVTTLASNHKVNSIIINSGAVFNITGFKLALTTSNPITNNGTFTTTNSTIEYNGTSTQNISFNNISYKNLKINNPSNVVMIGNINVNDTLSVVSGDLILFSNIITLAPSGFLTETPGNTLVGFGSGYITIKQVLNAPSSFNAGGLGAIITSSQNLDTVEIRRGHSQFPINGVSSVSRYYDISPKNNSNLNATLIYKYDDSELGGNNEGSLSLFRSTNAGSTFTHSGGTINTTANSLTLTGIDSFSRWTAGRGAVNSQIKIVPEGFYNLALNKLNMKDTVRIYLRNNFPPYAIVDSAKSVIDSITFTGTYLFLNAPSGNYYLMSKHRNSIETWSKSGGEAYTVGTGLNYDFTSSVSQAFGNNMTLKGTKACIFSGDVNLDGIVDGTDGLIIDNNAFIFEEGYVASDVNGDRIVDGSDGLIAANNSDNFVSKIVP